MFEVTLGNFIQVLIYSILLGGVYVIIALGLNLIFGVTRIINFAHGDLLMFGAYITFFLWTFTGLSPYLFLPLSFIATMIVGFGIYGLVHRQVEKPNFEMLTLITTFAFALVLVNGVRYAWTGAYRGVFVSLPSIQMGDIVLPVGRLVPFVAGILTAVALYYFLKTAYIGKALRAVTCDLAASKLMGINVTKVYLISCGIGCGLAGMAGTLLSVLYAVYPEMGFTYTILAFCIVVLGGLGSFRGALIASFVLAIAAGLTALFFGSAWSPVTMFSLIVLALLLRPARRG